ncbi:unnamed protein product [marine sediment metagenome]|uniref:Uncharacterized protein n=1 Tax=marine sediment metagenome TaxID=412755 RepID=X0WHD1_9ZZZZ
MKTETISELLLKFCVAKGVEASRERIDIQAKMIEVKFTAEQVKKALGDIFYSHQFFPDAAVIAKAIEPESDRDKAVEMSTAILEAARSYSEYDAKAAREHLGEIAWHCVERFGGWRDLTRVSNADLGQVRSQLRDTCLATTRAALRDSHDGLLPWQRETLRVGQLNKPNFALLEVENV